MTKQPSYRFAGYTDSWEQRKLGEVGVTKSGVGFPDSEQGGVRGIPFYKVSDMNNIGNEIEMVTSNNYVTQDQIDSRKWKVIDTVPAIMFAKVGAALLLNRKRLIREPFLIDNNTMVYIPSVYWEVMFCKILFDTLNLSKYSQVGALPSYNGSDIEAIQVSLPSLPEQTAIGSFFQDMDQLISLQQRKLEVLKEQKKTYLKLLFPAKGQTKPALRFAGFEDDWKEVKLGEIAELKRGLTYKPTSVVEKGIRVLRSSNIDGDVFKKQEDDVFVEDSSVTIPYVQFGDILITAANGSSKLVGKHAIIEDSEKMVHGGFMLLARSKQYKFLNALLSSEWYSRFINVSVAGGNGAIGNLSKSNLEKEIVLCPTIPEQEAIGSFFQDLDKTIAKQEGKVNQLKESKQTLLRKMFI